MHACGSEGTLRRRATRPGTLRCPILYFVSPLPRKSLPESVHPGLHESVITHALDEALQKLEADGHLTERQKQQLDWLDDAMSRHVADRVRAAVAALGGDLAARAALIRRVLAAVDPALVPGEAPLPTRDALTWVGPAPGGQLGTPRPPKRPEHGLVHPSLLFNGAQDISLVHELRRELASADAVDAIVSFLRWSGLRLLSDL